MKERATVVGVLRELTFALAFRLAFSASGWRGDSLPFPFVWPSVLLLLKASQ